MNLQISGKNIDLTEAIKAHVEKRVGGLEKYNDSIIEGRVIIEHIREDRAESFKVSAHLHISHDNLHAEATASDAYAAIDATKSELERQLRDLKEKYASLNRKARKTKRSFKSIFFRNNKK